MTFSPWKNDLLGYNAILQSCQVAIHFFRLPFLILTSIKRKKYLFLMHLHYEFRIKLKCDNYTRQFNQIEL